MVATCEIETIADAHISAMQMYWFMGRVKATDVRPTDGVLLVKHCVPRVFIKFY